MSQLKVKGKLKSCVHLEFGEHDFILDTIYQTLGLSLVIVIIHLLSLTVPIVL